MKISKKTLLIMGGIFSISSLGLMFVSAAEKILSPDLDNAIQHINEVKFVFTGNNGAEATLKFLDGNLVKIEADSGFLLLEDNQDSPNMSGDYSSVLGGYKNRKGGSYDVILGGSGNSVRGMYNSILGGEGNSITGGSYNTIIGGIENYINGKSSLYSVIIGGIRNVIEGTGSVVMGSNSSVEGNYSVALGSGVEVDANRSFLWTDGSESDTLKSDDVFAVMAQSGVAINVDKAHSFAKLSLGGPMILFVGRTGENVACGGGVGGGILKVVESENNQMCMCSCDGKGWSSMFGKGRCMSVCDVSLEPECGDTVTKVGKNIGGRQYAVYSGSCERGKIVEGTGAYLVTKDNKVHWSCQTEDGLVVGCSGSVEGGYVTVKTCGGVEPTGVGVVTGSRTYVGNNDMPWQGNDNISVTPGACRWKCGTGYKIDHQNGLVNGKPTRCKVEVVEKVCTGTPPTNADWVNNKFTQTWNGSEWTPGNVEISYWDGDNTKPCSYKCKTNFTWNETAHKCELGTGSCGTKLAGSGYVFGPATYMFGYTPTSWTYYTGGTLGPCLYKCDTGYDWNGTSCEAKIYQCTGQVPSNAVLVPGSTGGLTTDVERHLYPSLAAAGSNKCAYLCDYSNHYIYSSEKEKCEGITSFCVETETYKCVSPATAIHTGYRDNRYTWDCAVDGISEPVELGCFKCKDGYTWDGSKCVGEEKYKICYMGSNKYRVADNEPLPFLLNITVRCGIGVGEVFNKTYTINTGDLISTGGLPNKSCTIINAQYEPSLFNPEDRVEYIGTCEGSCFGCPSGMVENGGKCISYKSSYSCECQDLKVTSHCVNGEWDKAPASFSSCTAYTGQDQICVGYRREYSDPASRHNDPDYYSKYGCTRQDQPVGGDCSVLCAETNNHECVKDNNISPYDTININTNCCVCGYANVCDYDFKLPNKPVDSLYGKWGRDESYRIDLWSQHPSWPHNWDLFNW